MYSSLIQLVFTLDLLTQEAALGQARLFVQPSIIYSDSRQSCYLFILTRNLRTCIQAVELWSLPCAAKLDALSYYLEQSPIAQSWVDGMTCVSDLLLPVAPFGLLYMPKFSG